MKAALWTAVFFVVAGAETGRADPKVQSATFNCEYRSQEGGSWEKRSAATVSMNGRTLIVDFNSSNAMNSVGTTNTGNEYRVEARCPGTVTLSDGGRFKIRDFAVNVNNAYIGSEKGTIELKVQGTTIVTGTNQKDGFDKYWKLGKSRVDSGNFFDAQVESNTVCGNQLTLRFEDLRTTVWSDPQTFEFTEVSLNSLLINLDPC
jgi:hypothetical protein